MPSSPARRSRSLTDENNHPYLVVQTNVSGRLFVWLVHHNGRLWARTEKKIVWHGSEQMLTLIDVLLKRSKIQLTAISGILVVRGPGPFTAVRTGLVIANTLGMILDIPVQGIVTDQPLSLATIGQHIRGWHRTKKLMVVKPWYGKEPNITLPRRKG